MSTDLFRYDQMVENALKGVVRAALDQIAEHGLPDDHHLYLTFDTTHPEVKIPNSLKQKYPNEMTIVLQYQFWDLDVSDEGFAVSLSFNDVHQRMQIPFSAVTGFADPSVNFALQFQVLEDFAENDTPVESETALITDSNGNEKEAVATIKSDHQSNNVVTLDTFRKD